MYRVIGGNIEYYLAHPGGPYFSNKDEGYWGIPKGLPEGDENLVETAAREFQEETGFPPPSELREIGSIRMTSGKIVYAFACEWTSAEKPPEVKSNTCRVEWPPRSGKHIDIPEIDNARFFPPDEAERHISDAQRPFLQRVRELLSES
jgi:predicted NUDIX family NTP pyrophosphohydrolase